MCSLSEIDSSYLDRDDRWSCLPLVVDAQVSLTFGPFEALTFCASSFFSLFFASGPLHSQGVLTFAVGFDQGVCLTHRCRMCCLYFSFND